MASNGIYPALSGASAGSQAMEVLANNVANSASGGFRAQRLGFHEVLTRAQGGARGPASRRDLRFVGVDALRPDPTPGPLRQSGAETDLALKGPGFLVAATGGATGPRYLRGGALQRDPEGRLLTAGGAALLGTDDQPLRVPAGALSISARGEVRVDRKVVGALKVVEFDDPARLRPVGGGLHAAPAGAAARAATQTEVLPGYLEGANVNPVKAMTDVIVCARHYEALHRVIETYREVDTTAARDLGSVP